MDFYAVLDQVVDLLRSRQRATYRTLKRQFNLDDAALEDLKEELLFTYPQIVDEDGRGLVWTCDTVSASAPPAPAPPSTVAETRQAGEPLSYTPPHLAEKILTSRSALEGERISNDLHMDYSAVGQTTHLAARMEQLAPPGGIRLTAATLRLLGEIAAHRDPPELRIGSIGGKGADEYS